MSWSFWKLLVSIAHTSLLLVISRLTRRTRTLPPNQRDVFLECATPKSVAEARLQDESHFEKANYGSEFSLLTGYWPGAAWAWLVSDKPDAGFIGYNDV